MSIDINKPVVYKGGAWDQVGRVLAVINNKERSFVVLFRYDAYYASATGRDYDDLIGQEYVLQVSGSQLTNVPESRWMNVYPSGGGGWWPTRNEADENAKDMEPRIAIIEDRQDGSLFTVYTLRGKDNGKA